MILQSPNYGFSNLLFLFPLKLFTQLFVSSQVTRINIFQISWLMFCHDLRKFVGYCQQKGKSDIFKLLLFLLMFLY